MRATNHLGAIVDTHQASQLVVNTLLAARDLHRKVLLVGNGGSAATVSHLHNDLVKALGIRALCLHEPALLTATANDEGFEHCFEHTVERWADRDDLLFAISCSGESENVLRAVEIARMRACQVITLTGFAHQNTLSRLGMINFHVPSDHFGTIEIAHAALTHYLTDAACAALSQSHAISSRQDGTHEPIETDIIGRTVELRATRVGHRRGRLRRRRVSA